MQFQYNYNNINLTNISDQHIQFIINDRLFLIIKSKDTKREEKLVEEIKVVHENSYVIALTTLLSDKENRIART